MREDELLVFGLTSPEVRSWLEGCVQALDARQELLNTANVFPVADADTGTNMLLTVRGALERISHVETSDATSLLIQGALGALTHARGNSGIILAEYLRGLALTVEARSNAPAPEQLAAALQHASDRAYSAVAQPVEGTILTAARAAAEGAAHARDAHTAAEVLRPAIQRALEALERSHLELGVLQRAGVLDAGAYGLILVLASLYTALSNDTLDIRRELGTPLSGGLKAKTLNEDRPDGEFEVMCLVHMSGSGEITDELAEQHTLKLRTHLATLGESVVVIGGAQGDGSALWSVHIHTETPDEVICSLERSASVQVELSQVVVRNLVHQLSREGNSAKDVNIVVCTTGPALALDLSRAGAVVCVERGLPLHVSDIERALTEVHGAETIAPVTSPDTRTAVVVSNSDMLSTSLRSAFDGVEIVEARDDAQVVAATTTLVQKWTTHHAHSNDDLAQSARDVISLLRTYRFDRVERSDVSVLVDDVRSGIGTPIVTVLADSACPQSSIADLCDGLERAHSDCETIVLGSGREGNGITASLEWIDE